MKSKPWEPKGVEVPDGRHLRPSAVSELTGIPLATLRYWRHLGKGPRSFQLGDRVVYKASDVTDWIEEQYQAAKQPTTKRPTQATTPAPRTKADAANDSGDRPSHVCHPR